MVRHLELGICGYGELMGTGLHGLTPYSVGYLLVRDNYGNGKWDGDDSGWYPNRYQPFRLPFFRLKIWGFSKWGGKSW